MADEKDLVLGGEGEPDDDPELVYDPLELMGYMIDAWQFLDSIDLEVAGGEKTKTNVLKAKRRCLELILSSIFSL